VTKKGVVKIVGGVETKYYKFIWKRIKKTRAEDNGQTKNVTLKL
jgi:hypothetical protein